MLDASYCIEAKPVPASRPRVSRNGGVFYNKTYTAYRGVLDKFFQSLEIPETLKVPVEVRILCVMPRYSTSDYPTYRADVDNLAKPAMDAMTKWQFWEDDNLVVSLVSLKRFCRDGEKPHTKLRIIELTENVEDYIDRQFQA